MSCVDGFVVSAQLNLIRFQVETKRVRRYVHTSMYEYVFACRCRRCRRRHTNTLPQIVRTLTSC